MIEATTCPGCRKALPEDAPHGLCPACLLRFAFGSEGAGDNGRAVHTVPHGAPFVPPTPAELALVFPHLEVFELLGQGGMGAVYRARQKRLDRLIALKIIPAELAADPAFAERFAREARALARLSHPNIVAVYDFGEANGLYYFLMEYVEGVNLRQMMQSGPIKPEEALALVPQVCAALQYAHDQGVVHRDIKPENILVDRQGRVKIADFGLAKLLGPTRAAPALTASGQVMGTPHYMAPEQVEHPLHVDHRADIYSLGVVFYEMLTGELPLGHFPPPSRKASVDARLDQIVLRTLQRDPGGRYQQASEIRSAVEEITRLPLSQDVEALKQALDLSNHELVSLAGIVLCLGLLGVALWASRNMVALFGLLFIAQVAARMPLRSSGRLVAGIFLTAGGIGLSILAIVWHSASAWLLVPVWVILASMVYEFFEEKGPRESSGKEEVHDVEGLSPLAQAVWGVLWHHRDDAGLDVIPDLPAHGLHNARKACGVPGNERILALLNFTGDEEDCSRSLLFGCLGIYCRAQKEGQETTVAIPYEEFPQHTFVNHGLGVYLAHGVVLEPDLDESPADCETITGLLNALRKAIVEFQQKQAAALDSAAAGNG